MSSEFYHHIKSLKKTADEKCEYQRLLFNIQAEITFSAGKGGLHCIYYPIWCIPDWRYHSMSEQKELLDRIVSLLKQEGFVATWQEGLQSIWVSW